jgi:NitT/TauT family transport system substrate-binding protein
MRFSRLGQAVAVATITAMTLAACGDSGSDSDKTPNPQGLEKPVLNVGVVPVPDSAPLAIAMQKGFFAQEGLTIKRQVIKASPEATPKLINGSMDLALLNYVSTFVAQDKGAAKFKLLTDSYQGTNNSFALLTGKDSKIKELSELKGKKIAVPAPKSITDLLLAVTLKANGVDRDKDVQVVPVPLPSMGAALKQGTVDAVATVEPFVTNIQAEQGARRLADLVNGPTKDFPIAGWGGTDKFAEKNPKTVAAFQRAISKALNLAASNRNEVTRTIPTYTEIPAKTASLITLGSYPTTLSDTRLQRVADLLTEYGYVRAKPNIAQMMVAPPK